MKLEKYIGTKQIEAIPMTRGVYYGYRGWVLLDNENPEDEGYLVKYKDEYVSWSPKEPFEEAYSKVGENPLCDTALLMRSEDFKERFQAEYFQLKARFNGLASMLEKYKAGTLPFKPKCSYAILQTQLACMEVYMHVLEERAAAEDINLEEVVNND